MALPDRDQRLHRRQLTQGQADAPARRRCGRSSNDVTAPLVESTWVEPYPDELLGIADGFAAPGARYEQREAVELAFIASLQHLPATQRAVLILRDVLGFSAKEVAERLDTSVASVNSALQRARKAVDERLPERSQQATLRALGDEEVRGLVEAYVDAWARRDVEAIAALLAEDAVFSMPPWGEWWRGRETIASFATNEECAETRTVPIRANGQAGARFLLPGRGDGALRPFGDRRAHARRRADQGDHRLRHARDLPALRSASGARALIGSS